MKTKAAGRWAKVGITIQFAALVRTLAEYFRLRHLHGSPRALSSLDPWVAGALIAAVLCWLSVTLEFFGWHRSVVAVSVLTVIVLLLYKLFALT